MAHAVPRTLATAEHDRLGGFRNALGHATVGPMDEKQTDDQLDIMHSQPERIFVGCFFAGLGVISLLAAPLLQHKPGDGLIPLFIGQAAFLLVGGFILATATRQHMNIRRNGKITISSKRYIGGNASTRTYDTSAVSSVEYVQFAIPGDTESTTDRGSFINLILQDGSKLKVASQRLPKVPFRKKLAGPLLDTAKQVAGFLGVPLQHDPQRWQASE